MNLHQLRFIREAVRQNLNLTAAARSLYTSQPGISKAIIELEDELGIEIFSRHGKRLRAVTAQGKLVVAAAERIMGEVDALRRVRLDYAMQDQGELVIATTHTFARYWLPQAIADWRSRFPKMAVAVMPVTPAQAIDMARDGSADLAVTTADLPDDDVLMSFPCASLNPMAIFAASHPLARRPRVEFAEIAAEKLVVEDEMFGQGALLSSAGLKLDVAVRACDAETVKACVGLGLGVGIVADLAFDPRRDHGLRALPIAAAQARQARIALRRDAVPRRSVQALAELLSSGAPKDPARQPVATEPIAQMTRPENVTPLRRPLPCAPVRERKPAQVG
ncbi:LysR substrate-binding domain-containing protein [Paraburkholderia oxyphila]|uniref:LysR substrate-binding domain-containing protein n=1 Tax=Paraburkholderia oxyphila TaxID=614212 RepID=UPI000693FDD4|nr:LysR substrate-binding domain-containing protein [Paraburkholderia oxyphila]